MSGIEDVTSQEIEASTSSHSTPNSRKRIFLKSILNDNLVHSEIKGTRNITLGDKIPRLPWLEKRDFIENWLSSHNLANSPEKSCTSPILGVAKRKNLVSPILGYKRKRATRGTKENLAINSNENSRFNRDRKISKDLKNKSLNKNSRLSELDFSADLNTTHETINSSALNFNTSTSTLNTTPVSRRLSWTTEIQKWSKDEKSANLSDYRNRARKLSKTRRDLNTFEPIEDPKIEDRKRSLELPGKCDDDRESKDLRLSLSKVEKKFSKDSKIENGGKKLGIGMVNSSVKFESISPLRWNGYRNEISKKSKQAKSFSFDSPIIENDLIVMESSSEDEPQVNLNIDDRGTISSENSPHRAKRQKQEREVKLSPLRWNFRQSLLRESSKIPETLSLSEPLVETAGIVIESSSMEDPRENLNNDCQSPASSRNSLLKGKKCKKFDSESPLRWNGYEREILASKLEEIRSQKSTRNSLNSPEIDKDCVIAEPNSTDDDRNNLKFENPRNSFPRVKKTPTKFESESPLRWNGYRREIPSLIIPETLSLDSPEIESEQMIIESNSTNVSRHSLRIANQKNVSLRIRTSPTKFDPESPIMWPGYRNEILASKLSEKFSLNSPRIKSDGMTIESNSAEDPRENLKTDDRGNFSSRGIKKSLIDLEKSPTKFESESPLRWNGYGNEISEHKKIRKNPPLIKTGKVFDFNDDLSIDNRIGSSYNKSKNIPVESVEKSPSRWNGYGNEISEFRTIPETLPTSPLIETEKFNFKENSSVVNRIGLSYSESKNKEKLPCRWKRHEIRKSVKIPDTSLMSLPSIASGRTAIKSNCTIDAREELKIDNQSQESQGLVAKERSPEFKPELAQMFKNRKIRESLKFSNTLSASSQLLEDIDVESCMINAPEDDLKIESDSDCAISDVIENISTQNPSILRESSNILNDASPKNVNIAENFEKGRSEQGVNESYDSDETFCSNGEHVFSKIVRKIQSSPEIISQKISQLTNNSQKDARISENKSDISISQAISPLKNNSGLPLCALANYTTCNIARKKKKAKKGTLVAKLQSLVNLQISNLNIWQHQMTLHNFRMFSTQFVLLTICERATRYGRHFLIASMIEDSHNLLKCLWPHNDNSTNSRQETQTITLMIIPEINGKTKIQDNSTIKIYPPWEIMDQRKRVLSITYFDVKPKNNEINDFSMKNVQSSSNEKIIDEFDCPCIQRGAIDKTCQVKFTDTKPSVMRAMFR